MSCFWLHSWKYEEPRKVEGEMYNTYTQQKIRDCHRTYQKKECTKCGKVEEERVYL